MEKKSKKYRKKGENNIPENDSKNVGKSWYEVANCRSKSWRAVADTFESNYLR